MTWKRPEKIQERNIQERNMLEGGPDFKYLMPAAHDQPHPHRDSPMEESRSPGKAVVLKRIYVSHLKFADACRGEEQGVVDHE